MKTLFTTRVVVGLAAVVFLLADLFIVKAGLSDSRQLFSLLLASYLAIWGATRW